MNLSLLWWVCSVVQCHEVWKPPPRCRCQQMNACRRCTCHRRRLVAGPVRRSAIDKRRRRTKQHRRHSRLSVRASATFAQLLACPSVDRRIVPCPLASWLVQVHAPWALQHMPHAIRPHAHLTLTHTHSPLIYNYRARLIVRCRASLCSLCVFSLVAGQKNRGPACNTQNSDRQKVLWQLADNDFCPRMFLFPVHSH